MSPEGQPAPGQNLEEVRKRLLRLVPKKGCRILYSPSVWNPGEVRGPDGLGVTERGAWELLEEWLAEESCMLKAEILKKGKDCGKIAYWFEKTYCNQPVYVKLRITDGDRVVYGISFHISRFTKLPPMSESSGPR
jgi:hypothetical protein